MPARFLRYHYPEFQLYDVKIVSAVSNFQVQVMNMNMGKLPVRNYYLPILLLLTAALSIGGAAHHVSNGQDPKSEQKKKPGEALVRLETELVQIDVVVTDKDGKMVRDLKREDFELFEDGKPQNISYFSRNSTKSLSAATAAQPATGKNEAAGAGPTEVVTGRNLVLAIDDLHLSPGNLMLAKKSLLKFIDQQIDADDQVALITTSGRLGLYEQFTTEREALRRAINRLSPQERSRASQFDTPRITPYQAERIDDNDPEALEIAVQEIVRDMNMQRPQAVNLAQSKARMLVAENVAATTSTLSTIENIIRGLKQLPGRKIMVLVSDGFLLGSFRDGKYFDVRRITDSATKAGVVIYSLDARGLIAEAGSMDASQPNTTPSQLLGARMRIERTGIEAQRDGIFALARDTGGTAFFNNNDMNIGLKKVLENTETWYLLAFEPNNSYRDGKFRKLEVRLPQRKDLKIRTRSGYFAPDGKAEIKAIREKEKQSEKDKEKSPEKLAKDQQNAIQAQIRDGISTLFPQRGIPIQMTASFLNLPDLGAMADVSAHLDAKQLKFDESGGRYRASLEIIGFAFDEAGNVAGSFSDTAGLNLKQETYEKALQNGIAYSKYVKLKPGFYQIRIMAREDGTTQIGSASAWIEIPDLGKQQLTLSSIFFTPQESVKQAVTMQNQPGGISEKSESALPPKVYRRFKRGSNLDFLLFAYNPKLDAKGATDLAIQIQIYQGSKLVLASPLTAFSRQAGPNINPTQGLPYFARVPLNSYDPGTYDLRLLVIDRVAKSSSKRSINFFVE